MTSEGLPRSLTTTTTSAFEPFFADNEYCRHHKYLPFGAVVSGTMDLGGPQDIVDLGEDPSYGMAEALRGDPAECRDIPRYHEGVAFRAPLRRGVVEDRAPEVDDVLRACEVMREHWDQFNGLWSEEELMAFVQCGGDERLDLHDYERVHLRLYCQGYYPSPEGLPDHERDRRQRRRGLRRNSIAGVSKVWGILTARGT